MTKLLNKFAISFLVIAPCATAMGGVFTYEARYIDSELGQEACDAMMNDAATRFAADAAVRVISSGCEVDRVLGRLTGKIVYSAPESIYPWSTTNTTYGEQIEFYVNKQQCEEALPTEIQLIESRSSLRPFIAFCHKISEIGPPRYRTRIDAVGNADLRRYESVAVTHYTLQNLNGTVQTLHEQAQALGLTPFAWYFGPIRSQRGLSVAYYADRSESPYRLLSKNTLYFSTLQDCEAAISSFNQTRTTDWIGAPACTVAHPSVGFQLSLIWWDRAIGADLIVGTTPIPGAHVNLDACRSSAAELASQLAQDGEKVLGIICGRDSSSTSPIKMELITLRR